MDHRAVEEIKDVGPVEAFERLRRLGGAFIMTRDRLEGLSYVGAAPACVVATGRRGVTFVGGRATTCPDPFAAVGEILKRRATTTPPASGIPFTGGAVGYFSYDLKDLVTPVKAGTFEQKTPAAPLAPLAPLATVGIYDVVYVYDHAGGRGLLLSSGGPGSEGRFEAVLNALRGPAPPDRDRPEGGGDTVARAAAPSSNFTREAYIAAVDRAKDYISEGDIYQINLSQRLAMDIASDPADLYGTLLRESPAPFSTLLDCGPFQVVSNSPERLLSAADGWLETSPIKGTRPRGATPELDRALIEELRGSVKERAEHVMIVDLERNDLGMVSAPGTVEVVEFERVETLPGLHHMVSTVRGKIAGGLGPLDCLRAAFPGGSITGAPKIRAMEIIDEIETVERSIYTGGIGWAGFDGAMDIAMAIRTGIVAGSTLHLHVGGGIVADSVPEDEYEETLLKARDFLDAAGAGRACI
ncbi:MAG: anthranilate synthase component I family protein [Thermodesulfobacteriota bacterium]